MKTDLDREKIEGSGFRFAIVVSRWHDDLTSRLAKGAAEAFAEAGVEAVDTFHVPGAFELPVASLKAAQSKRYDAIVALGVVIRGDTPHFDYVAGQAAAGIMRVSIDTGVPVLFGVITADTLEQAQARSGERTDNKGFEAALSAIEMASLFRSMSGEKMTGWSQDKVFANVV